MPVTRVRILVAILLYITYIVAFCGFRFFFRYMSKFSLFFHPGTPKHSQLQEFLGTLIGLLAPACRMKTTHDQVAGEKHEILKLTVL